MGHTQQYWKNGVLVTKLYQDDYYKDWDQSTSSITFDWYYPPYYRTCSNCGNAWCLTTWQYCPLCGKELYPKICPTCNKPIKEDDKVNEI